MTLMLVLDLDERARFSGATNIFGHLACTSPTLCRLAAGCAHPWLLTGPSARARPPGPQTHPCARNLLRSQQHPPSLANHVGLLPPEEVILKLHGHPKLLGRTLSPTLQTRHYFARHRTENSLATRPTDGPN